LGIREAPANEFPYIKHAVLTNVESVEVPIVIISKSHPTTVTLHDGQLHLEREVAEYPGSRTTGEIIVWLLAGVISPSGKLT
jgi:hypothetical protein